VTLKTHQLSDWSSFESDWLQRDACSSWPFVLKLLGNGIAGYIASDSNETNHYLITWRETEKENERKNLMTLFFFFLSIRVAENPPA
jgi:hypothetical protein